MTLAGTVYAAQVSVPSSPGLGYVLTGLVNGNYTPQATSSVRFFTLTTSGTSGAATYSAGTLNIPQYSGGGGSGTVSTSSSETSTQIPFWTTNSATPALLSGGNANFTFNNAANRLSVTYASTTAITATTFFGTLVGNASTATALAANGTNCSAGNYPLGVDASGNSENCTLANTGSVTSIAAGLGLTGGTITTVGTLGLLSYIATGTVPTSGQLAYWGSAGTPSTLFSIATNTLVGGGPITVSNSPVIIGGSSAALGCTSASSGVTGCLTGTDWNTFNGKQAALALGAGFVTSNAGNALTATASSSAFGTATLGQVWGYTGSGAAWIATSSLNQTITLTGVVTGSGATSITTSYPTQTANLVLANASGITAAPTFVATSTFFGTGTNGTMLVWSAGIPQWMATSTFATTTSDGGWGFTLNNNAFTLNIPQAKAANPYGLLSSADWTTFNGKQPAIALGAGIITSNSGNVLAANASSTLFGTATAGYVWGMNAAGAAGWIATSSAGGGVGTVTSIAAGLGLTGGTITSAGTLGLLSYIATGTVPTQGQLAYWGSAGTPSTLFSIATNTLVGGGPITVSNNPVIIGGSSAALGCTSASSGVTGCLTGTDWNTFNNKQATMSATWPISISGGGPIIQWSGLASTSNLVVPQILYATGVNTYASAATSSLTASGVVQVTNLPSIIGASSAAITVVGGTNGQILGWSAGVPTWLGTTTAGTGLSYTPGSPGSFSVNSSQSIATLSNLTNNGFVITSGGVGTLGVQQYPATVAEGGTNQTSLTGDQILYTPHAGTSLVSTASSSLLGVGTLGQVFEYTGGGGAWTSTTTQAAAGSDLTIQYNNDGAFMGSSNFAWDDVLNGLMIGTTANSGALFGTSTLLQMSTSSNNFIQSIIQNTSNAGDASADVVVGNDKMTNTSYYGDFGITSSAYANPTYAGETAGDVFLTSSDSGLNIEVASTSGTATPFNINFFVGGLLSQAKRFIMGISTTTANTTFVVATTSQEAFQINDAYGTNVLNVNTASTTGAIFTVQATSSTIALWSTDQYGHTMASSTFTPVLSACGTTPTLSAQSSDVYGLITLGTTATGCVLTFGRPYANAPVCSVDWQATPLASQSWTVTATALTIVQTSTTNDKVDYMCFGN